MYRYVITLPDGKKKTTTDPEKVYYIIALHLCEDLREISETDHNIAANAEGWCELLAYPGTNYTDPHLPGLAIDVTEGD